MVTWNNLDKLASFEELKKVERVNLAEVMSGENGAERVKSYSVPMAEGLAYNYAAKQVNEDVLAALVKLQKRHSFLKNLRSFTTVLSSTPERTVSCFIS